MELQPSPLRGNQIGLASELLVLHRLTMRGVSTALVQGNHLPYDLLAHIEGFWCRVQVKTARMSRDRRQIRVDLSRPGRTQYGENDFEYLAVVWHEEVFLIPWRAVWRESRAQFAMNSKRVNESGGVNKFHEFRI